LKRLALLWLACAAVGFAVAASALAAPTPRQNTASDRSNAATRGYSGQRLLGN
jgi:hypothetical protein